jgi:Site-specific DNA methylase
MRVGSLFSGIGGFDLGFERAGFDIAWQVEFDPFCQINPEKALAKRQTVLRYS